MINDWHWSDFHFNFDGYFLCESENLSNFTHVLTLAVHYMPHHVKRHTSSSSLDEVNFQAVLAYLAQIRIGRRAAHGWLGLRARIKIILELWNVMRERLWKIWSQRSIGPTCEHNGKLYSGQKFELSGPWADLSWAKCEAHNQFSDMRDVLLRKNCFSFGFCPNYIPLAPLPPNLDNLYNFFRYRNSRFEKQFWTKDIICTTYHTTYLQPKKQF